MISLKCTLLQKTRYSGDEDELPPPPSPPQLKDVTDLDGVPRSGERIIPEPPVVAPVLNHIHVPTVTKVHPLPYVC